MTDYGHYQYHMNMYDTMIFNKCINMTYDSDVLSIICNPNAFNFVNILLTTLLSASFGVFLSFALVASFMNYDENEDEVPSGESVDADCDADPDTSNNEEMKQYIAKCNEEFDALPKDGYVIQSYPFIEKYETTSPFGDIIMFLAVYDSDYYRDDDSIEYTYYTQTNTWTFDRLLCIAKQIAVKLNTKQFYKDKTIMYGTTKSELVEEREKERELAKASVDEDTQDENNTEPTPPIEPPSNQDVFARFKSYNKGTKPGRGGQTNTTSEPPVDTKDDIVIVPVKMRRAGTIEEYKIECLKEEVKRRTKNISFGDFNKKSNND